MEIVHERATFLPNPDVERKQCVKECLGCDKMYSDENIGDVCIAYINPKNIHRIGCGLQSNKIIEVSVKKKINPIKASKRGKR